MQKTQNPKQTKKPREPENLVLDKTLNQINITIAFFFMGL